MKYINKILRLTLFCMILIFITISLSGCDSNTAEDTSEAQDLVASDGRTEYSAIIEEYKKFVDCLINEDVKSAFDNNIFSAPDNILEYHWNCMLVEVNIWSYKDFPKTRNAFGYALEDLNGDGNAELILLLQDYTVLAVFSTENGESKLIDAFWPKHRCAIYDTGLLYTLSSGGAYDWYYKMQKISQDGSELLDLEEYGSTSDGEKQDYYKVIDGETHNINKSELDKFHENFPILSDITASEITKNSGIKFIPLFE